MLYYNCFINNPLLFVALYLTALTSLNYNYRPQVFLSRDFCERERVKVYLRFGFLEINIVSLLLSPDICSEIFSMS